MGEEKATLQLVMSVAVGVWPASISTMTEAEAAKLTQEYPEYHFFMMEVRV